MSWQLAIVLLILASAIAYLGWRAWRSLRPAKGDCGGGCGCAKNTSHEPSIPQAIIPSDSLTRRIRPGPEA